MRDLSVVVLRVLKEGNGPPNRAGSVFVGGALGREEFLPMEFG